MNSVSTQSVVLVGMMGKLLIPVAIASLPIFGMLFLYFVIRHFLRASRSRGLTAADIRAIDIATAAGYTSTGRRDSRGRLTFKSADDSAAVSADSSPEQRWESEATAENTLYAPHTAAYLEAEQYFNLFGDADGDRETLPALDVHDDSFGDVVPAEDFDFRELDDSD